MVTMTPSSLSLERMWQRLNVMLPLVIAGKFVSASTVLNAGVDISQGQVSKLRDNYD